MWYEAGQSFLYEYTGCAGFLLMDARSREMLAPQDRVDDSLIE